MYSSIDVQNYRLRLVRIKHQKVSRATNGINHSISKIPHVANVILTVLEQVSSLQLSIVLQLMLGKPTIVADRKELGSFLISEIKLFHGSTMSRPCSGTLTNK